MRLLLRLTGLIAIVTALAYPVWAEEESKPNFEYKTVTTPEGLTFRVPEDMPIEKRGGIVAPIPFDEYMYGKFAKVEGRLYKIETKLTRMEELLQEIAGRKVEAAAPLHSAPARGNLYVSLEEKKK